MDLNWAIYTSTKGGRAMRTYERKLRKVGNSVVVSIPPELMKHLGIGIGDPIIFNDDSFSKPKKVDNSALDEEVDMLMKQVFDEHKNTFEALVRRWNIWRLSK